jgi:hypothetical protein
MLEAKAPWLGGDARVDGTLGVMSHCDAMKAGVVGRQRCKGTAVKWLNCIHIECSNDWEEMATSPDAARIMTSKGTIGYILVAADYHLKLLSDLLHRITARLRYTMARAASKTNMSWSSTSRHADGNIAPPRYGRGGGNTALQHGVESTNGLFTMGAKSHTSPADACTLPSG